jgi:hypothetical protein
MLLKSISQYTPCTRVFQNRCRVCYLTHQDVFFQISMRCVLEHAKVCFHQKGVLFNISYMHQMCVRKDV